MAFLAERDDLGSTDILTSLYRAMGVLEAFSFNDEPTLNEIVDKTGLPKTTAFRAIKTFVALDYLCYDPETRKYSLSPKLFRLGSIAIHARPLTRWARPFMERIREQFGETVHLNIKTGDERMCIESLASTYPLQVDMPVGHRSPLYAGATAKVLLSGMPDDEIKRYFYRASLKQITETTVTEPEQLWKDVCEIRKQGYAESYGERIKGVFSMSVPVYNSANAVEASLSVLVPTARIEDSDIEGIRVVLLQHADKLSRRLGATTSGAGMGHRKAE